VGVFCTIVKLFSWSVPRLMFYLRSSGRQLVAAVKFCFVWRPFDIKDEPSSTVALRLGNVSFELYFC